jgi:hypothetical protein
VAGSSPGGLVATGEKKGSTCFVGIGDLRFYFVHGEVDSEEIMLQKMPPERFLSGCAIQEGVVAELVVAKRRPRSSGLCVNTAFPVKLI